MAKVKLKAIMPDGNIATRSTDNDYSHVLAIEILNAHSREVAQRDVDRRQALIASLEAKAEVDAKRVEALRRRQAKAEAKLAEIPSEGSSWDALSWHSRYDLAAKARDKVQSQMAKGWWPEAVSVQIVEVS